MDSGDVKALCGIVALVAFILGCAAGCDVGKDDGRSEICKQMGYKRAELRKETYVCTTPTEETFIPGATGKAK